MNGHALAGSDRSLVAAPAIERRKHTTVAVQVPL